MFSGIFYAPFRRESLYLQKAFHPMQDTAQPTIDIAPHPRYVEVILPLPLHATFTYRLPDGEGDSIVPGCRVIVPFGRKKFYTAIVTGLPLKAPEGIEVRDVALVLDDRPVLRHPQLKLWEWMADYYLCAAGDMFKAAVPAGLKIESETFVEANPDYSPDDDGPLTDREAEVIQLLAHKGHLTVAQIAKALPQRGTTALVNRMISRGTAIVSEKLVERYRTRRETCVRVSGGRSGVAAAFAAAMGAPKQERLLLALVEMSGIQRGEPADVTRAALLERAGVSPAILTALVKKGVVETWRREVNRFRHDGRPPGPLPELSPAQTRARDEILASWKEHAVTLLHGVTASGKTEVYMHLIDRALSHGDQALYLVPEIALTTQLTRRLQGVFGDRVVVCHSKFSDSERVDIWRRLLTTSEPLVVIGARSAVFLPFAHLGVVIVDEEHDSSYKQFDPAPRYNARDTAIVLAQMHGARTLLGSATPAVETSWKARSGKFGLVKLTERYGQGTDSPASLPASLPPSLPPVEIVDMKGMRRTPGEDSPGALSAEAVTAVRHTLGAGGQAILFQNRRGYAPVARCRQCAWVPRCRQCDVALTWHQAARELRCHYCGAAYPLPQVCPQCGEPAIEVLGYGTERVEEETARLFPGARVARMDLDTTRAKESYDRIIDSFSRRQADILVGTQMVTKGLDFAGVETVVVVSADGLINQPDFRASERAFCMLTQVAGRAGRRAGQAARVLVQTWQPAHPLLGFVRARDYEGFYRAEIAQRERFCYPPFARIVIVRLRHREPAPLRAAAATYAESLRALLGRRVYGPEEPPVGRVQGLYIRQVMLKVEPTAPMAQVKGILRQLWQQLGGTPAFKGVTLQYDVDPQ